MVGNDKEVEDDVDYARPRVSAATHKLLKSEYSTHTSDTVKDAYDTIIQTVLRNPEILIEVVEKNSNEPSELTYTHKEKLEEIAELAKTLKTFPTKGEIDRAPETLSYLTYIRLFGSEKKLIESFKSEHTSIWKEVDTENIMDTKV